MRRPNVPLLITVFVLVMLFVGLRFIKWPDFAHVNEVVQIAHQKTAVYLRLTIQYDKPPLYAEVYDMRDIDGVSTAEYKVTGYSGKVITITAPPDRTTNVSFFSERVIADGVWELVNKPARGDTSKIYTVEIKQLADNKVGTRKIVFTDPHYWATTAGRQFQIHLEKDKPTPNLLTLNSTAVADPRYEQVVREFTEFGTPSFRSKVAAARAAVAKSR